MLTTYSSDPQVNAAVQRLLLNMAPNPYHLPRMPIWHSSETDADGTGRTMGDVVDVIEERFGERKARTIRFTVH